jgi:adenosylhomocysteine nucleosidase
LSARTGASAVDLESGAVARVAARHRLPFAVLRAVCDPAQRSLPPAALAALNSEGAIRTLSVLGSIVARPWQIPALLRLALDAALARHALARSARILLRHLYGSV